MGLEPTSLLLLTSALSTCTFSDCILVSRLVSLALMSPFLSSPPPGLYLKGHDVTKLASMAKLKAGRLAREVTDSCLQYWGGMGYTAEVEISRTHRDLRLLSIGAGTDEVMLSIICKLSGTLPK